MKKKEKKYFYDCKLTWWDDGWDGGLKTGSETTFQGRITEKEGYLLEGLINHFLKNKRIKE